MHPKDNIETRLRSVGDLLYDAIRMPGIPEARKVLLQQMRVWTVDMPVPPTGANKRRAAMEAEIRAIRAFVEVDRRLSQSDPAALQEPYPGSGMYRTGRGSDVPLVSETSGSPDVSA